MKKTVPFLFLIILFAVAGWYFFTEEPEAVHELPPPDLPPATPVETQQAEPQTENLIADPVPEPEPEVVPEPLPLLNESDPEVTRVLADIVGAEALTQYLVKDQAISRIVVTLDSLTSRQVPAQINPVRPADDKFIVDSEGDRVVLSVQNFARYDRYVALIEGADIQALMSTYQRYYPLFQEAWEENGGEGSFNHRLKEVIDSLLETPDVPGPVYLSKPEAVYVFEEPELEAMTAGQKILIRIGSANAAIVKEQLTEIRAGLNP